MPGGVPDPAGGCRSWTKSTRFGSFSGSLRRFSATDLAVLSGKALVQAGGIEASDINHVIFGNALHTSSDVVYLAWHVRLKVGTPESMSAVTVKRLCGLGFQAVTQGAQEIQLHHAEVVLCGGTESMNQALPMSYEEHVGGSFGFGARGASSKTCFGRRSWIRTVA